MDTIIKIYSMVIIWANLKDFDIFGPEKNALRWVLAALGSQ